jgi:hypothetical protein
MDAVRTDRAWTVSRYPAGCRFAFTIVHDADSAYSRRLAPLFDVFDDLGLRITVSAFAFWADWAKDGRIWDRWRASHNPADRLRAPKAVPLCDPEEAEFYRSLAARGHEIALHTPSETSSTREDLARAFDLFERLFGHRPRVYVEHSASSKRDALSHEGSDPASAYYCEDLLRQYDPWIWVDGLSALHQDPEGKYFEIRPHQSPLDRGAVARHALSKAFVRTGLWRRGDGNGFLESYSPENIDTLERDGGMALVYTHLDAGWLDSDTGRMRSDIRARLEYLAAKPGWFAPAGEILDRVDAVAAVTVAEGPRIAISNGSGTALERLLVRRGGDAAEAVVIDRLGAGETITADPCQPLPPGADIPSKELIG